MVIIIRTTKIKIIFQSLKTIIRFVDDRENYLYTIYIVRIKPSVHQSEPNLECIENV